MLDLLTKENITLGLVVFLFIWRIIDAILRFHKGRRHELEKLAFDMAKIKVEKDSSHNSSILAFYFLCLEALEKTRNLEPGLFEWIKNKEQEFDRHVMHLRGVIEDLERRGDTVIEKIDRKEEIVWGDLYKREITWRRVWGDVKVLMRALLGKKQSKNE